MIIEVVQPPWRYPIPSSLILLLLLPSASDDPEFSIPISLLISLLLTPPDSATTFLSAALKPISLQKSKKKIIYLSFYLFIYFIWSNWLCRSSFVLIDDGIFLESRLLVFSCLCRNIVYAANNGTDAFSSTSLVKNHLPFAKNRLSFANNHLSFANDHLSFATFT